MKKGDPFVFNPSRDEAWVAPNGPPLFLNIINVFKAEGGQT